MSEITPNTPNPVREDAYKQQLAAKLGIDPQYIPGSPIWHSEEEIKAIAEMFSNMSGGGVLVVHNVDGTLDKTWQEIHDAGFAVIESDGQINISVNIWGEDGEYGVAFWHPDLANELVFNATSASGYPSYTE